MKSKEIKQLLEKPVSELEAMLREQEEKLRLAVSDLQHGKTKNVKEKGMIRKTIARIKTAINREANKKINAN